MLEWLFGKPKSPKKLKFKEGEFAKLRMANVKGMITRVFPYRYDFDYKFEWWNTKTGKPERVLLEEFEIKKVKKK